MQRRKRTRQVDSYVDAQRLTRLAADLVKIPSVTGEEKAVGEFLADELRAAGLQVRTMGEDASRPNVVARLKGTEGRPVLIFNGHIDVVPPGDEKLWSYSPFAGTVENGKLLGRGSCDMKTGIAAMIEAVRAVQESGQCIRGDIVLECVVDEERGGYKGTKYVTDHGVTGDYCINCDGGDLMVGICSKGDYGVELTTIGKAAHASAPERGVNAIHQMIRLADEVRRIPRRNTWHRRRHRLVGPPLINISVIEGGLQRNMVPDRCSMIIDRRTVPSTETMDDARNEIRKVIEDEKKRDPLLRVELREIIDVDAYEVSEGEPVVQALLIAGKKVLGKRPRFTGCKGFTDGHWLTVNHGIPCATFGGLGGGVHGVDEYADLKSFVDSAKVYAHAAVALTR
ncbi:M20 family metallopeptidase [Candidatus Bathyarchaeota archaeon]|jgi:succinyl-diaminopimelate desuccinylase|nr:M20 family metallopeptidase [Candidatus Bathyarchaeota archaeon]